MGVEDHKNDTPKLLNIGIIIVSTTRTIANDKSGKWIEKRVKKEGHRLVFSRIVTDDVELIANAVLDAISDNKIHALIISGGTGISKKDVTIEAVRPMFKKELSAFGPIFSQLSFEKIDSAAIMSRATAGIIETTVVFCIPGSLKACKLACKALIFPELGHIVRHLYE